MKKTIILTLSIIPILSLSGCASVLSGTKQNVHVSTGTTYGASCALTNTKGSWVIKQTPGSVSVARSNTNLAVTCKKGGVNGSNMIASNTNSTVFGNIIVGGLIGTGIDMADGAAYAYPSEITVAMGKRHSA